MQTADLKGAGLAVFFTQQTQPLTSAFNRCMHSAPAPLSCAVHSLLCPPPLRAQASRLGRQDSLYSLPTSPSKPGLLASSRATLVGVAAGTSASVVSADDVKVEGEAEKAFRADNPNGEDDEEEEDAPDEAEEEQAPDEDDGGGDD